MANGPAGRKCCSARPSWSRSWAMVATMAGHAGAPSRRSRSRQARAASSARRRRRRRGAPEPLAAGEVDLARRRVPPRSRSPLRRSSRRRARPRASRAARRQTSSLNAIWASGSSSRRLEAQLLEPHRVAHAAVGDRHVQDRLGERRQRRPGADPLDQPARPCGERHRAQPPVALARARIDERDLQPRPIA